MATESQVFQNPKVKELNKKFEAVWATYHAQGLMGWDLEVYMPEKGARFRGAALAQLALMSQKLSLDMRPLISEAEKETGLNAAELGVVRNLKRDLNYFEKVPPRLIEDIQRISTEATVVWRSARKNSDFSAFRPHLEKIVALKREEAEKLGYEKHPYDALLDQFEEGLTVEDTDRVFSKLIPELRRIFEKVMAGGKHAGVPALESQTYEMERLKKVNEMLIEVLGMPMGRFRMDVSTHPFTSGTSMNDVRITTRYEGKDFKGSLYATIHECGHAIYGLQIDEALALTPVERGASLGVHESQSRFWENAVGRSREFIHRMMPMLKENLSFMGSYSEEQAYSYFNAVRPSKIRVEADELTYNFHIALRYDIEKRLISGEINASDLPSIWSETLEKYLGITPKNDAEGVLQDIHWSGASIGYFPTYSIGNVLVGVIWKALGGNDKLSGMVQRGEFPQLKSWLREKVHRHGSIYAPKELLKMNFGAGYDPEPLVSYLEQKFLG